MGQASAFERDFEQLRRVSADLFKAMDAAEAAFLDHAKSDAQFAAINFPLEEGLFDETRRLLEAWRASAAKLIRDLDAGVSVEKLSFERLFDKDAGLGEASFLQRNVPRRSIPAEAIVSRLASLLSVLGSLDATVREARPVLSRHHRQCEFHLLQIVERRQRADLAIDTASRELIDLKARLRAHMAGAASARSAAAVAASEEERRGLLSDQKRVQSEAERLVSERETLMRLIADVEDIVDALNAEIAATNVMAAKLSTDVEQSVALLKALLEQAPEAAIPAAVSDMLAAFHANPLAGLGLQERKRDADDAFRRRLAPTVSPAEEVPEAEAPASADDTPAENP